MARTYAPLALILLALLHFSPAASAGDCNDHGTLVDGRCNCTTPKPDDGSLGWAGDLCDVPVHFAAVSVSTVAADVTASCQGEPTGCNTLDAGHSVCFFSMLDLSLVDFGLRLQGEDGATLELQGLLVNPKDTAYPSSSTQSNFVIYTLPTSPYASYFVDRQSHGEHASGAYFCVSNKGAAATNFALRLAVDQCPFSLDKDGNKTVCSGHGKCESAACSCLDEWSRPQAPAYPGLGFEQCQARSWHLPEGKPAKQHMEMQTPGTWSFWNLSVTDPVASRYVKATITATADTASDVELYFKYWQTPGRAVSQYDVRSEPGDFRTGTSGARGLADLSSSILLDSSGPSARLGVWFLGVFVNGDECVGFDLTIETSSCPNDCSGEARGTCAPKTGLCTCKEGAAGADCSDAHAELSLGTPLVSAPRAGFAYDRMELAVGDLLSKAPGHSLSLVVSASFKPSAPLPKWVTERPLLLASGAPITNVSTTPSRAALQEPETEYTLTVTADQVPSGTLYLAVYNPINRPYELGYTLSVATAASCINGCSGHGTCGAADGQCACEADFAGPDCSVDLQQIKRSVLCQEGSLKEDAAWGVPNGKAYSVCVCSGPDQCAYTEGAAPQAYLVCSSGYAVSGADPEAIKLSDGRSVPGGGSCKKLKRGSSGGMVFFYCLLSVGLFCCAVVGSKFGLERYQVWRANQVGGYNELGGDSKSLWDAFTGARRAANNDSW